MFLGIVGHSGSGKSTRVRLMLGLLPPVRGHVHRPPGRRPRFGYLTRRFVFEPSFAMTTRDMVVMGRPPRIRLRRRVGPADRQAARELLALVGPGTVAFSREWPADPLLVMTAALLLLPGAAARLFRRRR